MCIESVMPSNHLILCRPILLLPSIFPSIRVFSSESALRIRWPKYWSFSFSIGPFNEYSGFFSLWEWLIWSPCCPRDSKQTLFPLCLCCGLAKADWHHDSQMYLPWHQRLQKGWACSLRLALWGGRWGGWAREEGDTVRGKREEGTLTLFAWGYLIF